MRTIIESPTLFLSEDISVYGWHCLEEFCASYGQGYRLVDCDEPAKAPNPVGMAGATTHAQLCEGRVVCAVPSFDSIHSIALEIGHAEAAAKDEQDASLVRYENLTTMIEQIAFLDRLCRVLLGDRRCP